MLKNARNALNHIRGELEGTYYALLFRSSLCVNTNERETEEWFECLYSDAVADTVRALSEVNYDKDLRLSILSGEGDEEAFGLCAFIFEDRSALDTFLDEYAEESIVSEAEVGLTQYLSDSCESAPFTVFECVCRETEVKALLNKVK